MKYFFFLLFVSITFVSCKKEHQKKIYIITEDAYNKARKKSLDSTYLEITTVEQKHIYKYSLKMTDSFIYNYMHLEKIIDDNNYLRIFNENCILIDVKSFLFEGKKTKVYKYLYDKEGISDDRTDYYFNDELGLIFAKNLAWNINIYYDSENLKQLHDSILKNEDKFKSSFKLKL